MAQRGPTEGGRLRSLLHTRYSRVLYVLYVRRRRDSPSTMGWVYCPASRSTLHPFYLLHRNPHMQTAPREKESEDCSEI